jgi:hypothetical protein
MHCGDGGDEMTKDNDAQRVSELNARISSYQSKPVAASDTPLRDGINAIVLALQEEVRTAAKNLQQPK